MDEGAVGTDDNDSDNDDDDDAAAAACCVLRAPEPVVVVARVSFRCVVGRILVESGPMVCRRTRREGADDAGGKME